MSTKDIPPKSGRATRVPLPRGATISVCRGGTARTERIINAEPPHLVVTMPAVHLVISSNCFGGCEIGTPPHVEHGGLVMPFLKN